MTTVDCCGTNGCSTSAAGFHEGMANRLVNFSAGPCCMPVEVLFEAQQDLLNYKGVGMSVMEMSHRSKEFLQIFDAAKNTLKELIGVPDDYNLMFMQGGASLQFAAVPINMLSCMQGAVDFAVTGSWSERAYVEGCKYAKGSLVCNTKASNFTTIPAVSEWKINPEAQYLHYCANETIYGVEFKETPKVSIPLVCDVSSNFCSKPIDVRAHDVMYAGAQKNLGPAGCAVVIAKKERCNGKELSICPSMLSYKVTADNDSMYNTPPCWTIYMIGLMAQYLKRGGGLRSAQEFSEKKARVLYDMIEASDGYYTCPADVKYRSVMNVPFRVAGGNEAVEKKFIAEAKTDGLLTLAGHRSVGGCRASLYNGMTLAGVEKLTNFMKTFQESNPI
eukprot:GHVS01075169.1.p1 GENE.GHVS01075169.1~~GHVS01075169.1.p1  ORF type:complete len:389 (+),score=58.70 GHVS01075169.1:138-1304(+)